MPRCPAKPWGPGGPSGPCGEAEAGDQTRWGGGTAPNEHGGRCPPKNVPRGRPRRVHLSRQGGRQGLGDRGHQHGPGDRHHHEHPWDHLCQQSRGDRGGLGYPVGGEDGVSANGGSFSSFITRILAPPGALGRLLHLKTLRKKTFLWADELPGITQQLFSSGTLHRLVTGMEQAASPKPLNPGVRNPGSSQAIPAAPKRTQLPQNSH